MNEKIFPDMPGMKRVYRDKKASAHLAGLSKVQSHGIGQSLFPPTAPIDVDLDDSSDEDLLHITYTMAAQRLSLTAPADSRPARCRPCSI